MAETDDIAAIKQVKYRYLRALDTKHWDDFAATLTDDVIADYGASQGESLHFTNRSDLVSYMSSTLGSTIITEHRVDHPEIAVSGDEATGVWYPRTASSSPTSISCSSAQRSTVIATAAPMPAGGSPQPDTTGPTRRRCPWPVSGFR